jgi:hypothetical protein
MELQSSCLIKEDTNNSCKLGIQSDPARPSLVRTLNTPVKSKSNKVPVRSGKGRPLKPSENGGSRKPISTHLRNPDRNLTPSSSTRSRILQEKKGTNSGNVKPTKDRTRTPGRYCTHEKCGKRLRLASVFQCRCGGIFCGAHRHNTEHGCTFDYRAAEKARLVKENPIVSRSRVPDCG